MFTNSFNLKNNEINKPIQNQLIRGLPGRGLSFDFKISEIVNYGKTSPGEYLNMMVNSVPSLNSDTNANRRGRT